MISRSDKKVPRRELISNVNATGERGRWRGEIKGRRGLIKAFSMKHPTNCSFNESEALNLSLRTAFNESKRNGNFVILKLAKNLQCR